MTDFFLNYGLFALKAVTLLIMAAALLALTVALIGGMIHRSAGESSEHLEVTRVNDRVKKERETLEAALIEPNARRAHFKAKRAERKRERKARKRTRRLEEATNEAQRHVYVLDFEGDLRASAVDQLRRELTAVLSVTRPEDEVVVRLESAGGLVHSYGLAASQLDRVRKSGVKLTVCVDKIAASGGYMMACVADRLLAAPFAVIGSIGVVAQLPNFHRLLKKHDVDFELFTAGEHKRTVTVFGENTEQGRNKFRQDLEDTHELFKEFVREHRPQVDIDHVATGEIWFGRRAIERTLVDELRTSDDYLTQACEEANVLEVCFVHKKTLKDKLSSTVEATVDRLLFKWWGRAIGRARHL